MKTTKECSSYFSSIDFHLRECLVSVRVTGNPVFLSPRQRRTILLSLIRSMKPGLRYWMFPRLSHHDWTVDFIRDERRGAGLKNSTEIETEPGRFGTWVRIQRQHRLWTQKKLAAQVGTSHANISLLERGKRKPRKKLREDLIRVLVGSSVFGL